MVASDKQCPASVFKSSHVFTNTLQTSQTNSGLQEPSIQTLWYIHTYILPKNSSCRSESQPIWANPRYTLLAKIISQADINKLTFADETVDGIVKGKLSPLCRIMKGQAHAMVLPLSLCISSIKNFYMARQALGSYLTSLPNDNRRCDRNKWKTRKEETTVL